MLRERIREAEEGVSCQPVLSAEAPALSHWESAAVVRGSTRALGMTLLNASIEWVER